MTVRKNGVVLPEFFAQRMKSFLWLPSDVVADQIGENGGVTGVHFDGVGNGTGDFISGRSLAQKFDMFGPRQSNERAHSRFGAGIEKPTRRAMINANNVKPGLANLG